MNSGLTTKQIPVGAKGVFALINDDFNLTTLIAYLVIISSIIICLIKNNKHGPGNVH